MRRDIFSEEHELFRGQFRRYAEAELAPRVEKWNREGKTDRESWRRAGEQGFLGANAVAEGNEFEGSRLTATFAADHYFDVAASDIFIDYYDGKLAASGLDLPPDDYPEV